MRRSAMAPLAPIPLLALLVPLVGCGKDESPTAGPTTVSTRGYRMGFSAFPPRPVEADYLRSVDTWIRRADAAILHESVPWGALLSGTSAEDAVRALNLPLVQGYKSRGLDVVFTIDPTNGLDRHSEDPNLVALGHSLREPAVQAVYRTYALAVAKVLQPSHLGLAAETNLIRLSAPRPVYDALVASANAAAADLRAAGFAAPLYVSVQVEVAWGRATGGAFLGIDEDLRDFPFTTAIGLSTYPFLGGFGEPEQVPLDYFSRLRQTDRPLLVVEGGWTSSSALASTPDRQARWVKRQFELAAQAQARHVFQLLFTDLDVTAFGQPGGGSLSPFAEIGLVTTELAPKPALAEWDAAFARPRR
jgi:hypothetical protein